jgi:WD40 repeat protein
MRRLWLTFAVAVSVAGFTGIMMGDPAAGQAAKKDAKTGKKDAQPPVADADAPVKPILAVDPGGHIARVMDFAFTDDGKNLFTVSEDNTIQIWDGSGQDHLKTLRLPWRSADKNLLGFIQAHSVLAVSPDGKTLAVTSTSAPSTATVGPNRYNYELFVMHADTGRIRRLPGFNKGDDLGTLVFSRDGDLLAAAVWTDLDKGKKLNARVCVWRGLRDAGQPEAPAVSLKAYKAPQVDAFQNGSSGQFHDLQFAPDGSQLAVSLSFRKQGALAGSIVLWNLKDESKPREINPAGAAVRLAWSPAGTRLAAEVVERKSNPNGLAINRLKDPAKIVAWTPDGLMLRSVKNEWPTLARPVFRNENDLQWTGASGPRTQDRPGASVRLDLAKNKRDDVARFTLPMDVDKLRLSPDHTRLASFSGAAPNRLAILGLDPKATLRPLYKVSETPNIAFDKSGTKFAWTGSDPTKLIAGINLQTAEALPPSELKAERFAPPASTANTGKLQAVKRFAFGGLIDILQDRKIVFTVYAAGPDWVICTPEGYYAATPGGEQKAGWHVNNGPNQLASFFPFERFRRKLHRPDVIALRLDKGSVALALKVANALRGVETRDVALDDQLPPKVVLTVLDQSKLPTLKLKAQATASVNEQPITSLRLMMDGRVVPGKETLVEFKEGKAKAEVEWTFELPEGEHQLAVLARSPDSSGVSPAIRLKTVNVAKLPVLHVLTIGINDYKDGSLDLKYAAPDAEALAASFVKHCKGQPFRDVKTTTLLNKQATSASISKEIGDLRKAVAQQDLVVVFFACHGVKHKKEYYLLTHEADVDQLDKTCLSGDALRKSLAEFKCQVLLMLDACHSAGFGEGKKLSKLGLKPATDDVARDLTDDDYGVAVLCAAMGHEKAEGQGGHGLFTQAMLEALEKKPGVPVPFNRHNQRVYVHHLYSFVFDEVSARTEERQHPFLSLPWVVESFVVR